MVENDTYKLHVVFRGLFVVDPQEDGVHVYLPDARTPGRSPTFPEPYREHTPVIEFHQDDWRNPSLEMPRLIHVSKPNKKPVALYFLDQEEIKIRAVRFPLAIPEIPEADRHRYNKTYTQIPDDVWILEEDEQYGIRLLHGFQPEIEENATTRTVATVNFGLGVFRSERRSLGLDGQELRWTRVPASELKNTGSGAGTSSQEEPPRPINLDLRVTLLIHRLDAVAVSLSTGAQLLLRPEEGQDLTLWIKNRELQTILQDSDLLPDPFINGCELWDRLDRDHEILYQLAFSDLSANLENVQIPVSDDIDISGGGCACGGVCRP